MGTADTRRRGVRVILPLALGIAAVLALGPVAAGAATVSAAWSAKIGSAGVNGKATISAYTTGTRRDHPQARQAAGLDPAPGGPPQGDLQLGRRGPAEAALDQDQPAPERRPGPAA